MMDRRAPQLGGATILALYLWLRCSRCSISCGLGSSSLSLRCVCGFFVRTRASEYAWKRVISFMTGVFVDDPLQG